MVGMTAAIIGSAVVGAGASALSASKNSKAIKQSTQAQTQANQQAIAAQQQARAENLALQQPIYNAGMPAIGARNALLGLNAAPAGGQGLPTPQGAQPAPYNALTSGFGGNMALTASKPWLNLPDRPGAMGGAQVTQQFAQPTQQSQADAFKAFRDSTGYQFRVGEGMDAINSGFAASGALQSGAALKALDDYRQNMASSEFGNYWNMLGEQQNLASGAANAMSGVNTTYANNAGNLAIANGQNLAQSAVARANNSNALLGSLGNLAGGVMGGLSYNAGTGGNPGTVTASSAYPMSGAYLRQF